MACGEEEEDHDSRDENGHDEEDVDNEQNDDDNGGERHDDDDENDENGGGDDDDRGEDDATIVTLLMAMLVLVLVMVLVLVLLVTLTVTVLVTILGCCPVPAERDWCRQSSLVQHFFLFCVRARNRFIYSVERMPHCNTLCLCCLAAYRCHQRQTDAYLNELESSKTSRCHKANWGCRMSTMQTLFGRSSASAAPELSKGAEASPT